MGSEMCIRDRCIPMNKDASYSELNIAGKNYRGKELLDRIDELVNDAYFGRNSEDSSSARDFMWYLWCGPKSPLFGKDKMCFFERTFIDDKSLHEEIYNPYYHYSENADVCENILNDFGIDKSTGHIINGHVPVKIKDGESPVKANGKLFVIDLSLIHISEPTRP